MTLGIVSGPVEGILTICVVYIITAIKGGASFWHQPMLPAMGVPQFPFIPDALYNLRFTTSWIIYGSLVLLFNTVTSIINVVSAVRRRKAQNQQIQYETDDSSSYKPLCGLLPPVFSWVLIIAYLHLQPTILNHHLVPFILFVGLMNAYSVGQMITAHLTKTSFPYQNVLILPLAAAIIDILAPRLGFWEKSFFGDISYQVPFIYMCLGLAIGVYGSFVVSF